jgi:HAD superfamily hydrolase (TIGR01509 family)
MKTIYLFIVLISLNLTAALPKIECFLFDYNDVVGYEDFTPLYENIQASIVNNPEKAQKILNRWSWYSANFSSEAGFWPSQMLKYRYRLPSKAFYRNLERARIECCKQDNEMRDLIQQLKDRGYRVGVVANLSGIQSAFMRRHGLFQGFDPVILSSEVNGSKPHQNIFRTFVRSTAFPARNCIYIDPYEENTGSAKRVGMQTHLYKTLDDFKIFLTKRGVL